MSSTAENNKRIARNSLLLYFRMFIVMCIQLYTSRIILKTLGVVDFGIYGVVGGIVTMFAFLNGALGSATSRYFTFELGKGNLEKLRKVFCLSVVNHIIIAIIILLLSETVGLWFLYEKMVIPTERMYAALWVFHISVLTACFSLTQVPYTAAIIAHERMGIYAYVGLVEVILKLAVVYAITYSPIDKLIFYAISLFILQVTVMMIYRFYCIRSYNECHFKLYKDKQLSKEMLQYASYDLIGNASVMVQGQGLNIILNMFAGPVANAARAIAFQVQGAVTQFSNNFMTAVRPQIIKYYAQNDIENMMKLVYQSSILCYVLLLMLILPLSLRIDYILKLWLGNYPDYTPSFTILVLINTLISAFRNPRTTIFHATGNIKLSNIITGGILCCSFPIGYILMRLNYHPNFIFGGMVFTTIMADISNLLILKRYIKYSIKKFLIKVHIPCIAITSLSIIPIFICHHLLSETFINLINLILITIIIISFTTFYLGLKKEVRKKYLVMAKEKIWKSLH